MRWDQSNNFPGTCQKRQKKDGEREKTEYYDLGRGGWIEWMKDSDPLSLDDDCKSFFLEYRRVALHEMCEGTEIFLIQKRDSDFRGAFNTQ